MFSRPSYLCGIYLWKRISKGSARKGVELCRLFSSAIEVEDGEVRSRLWSDGGRHRNDHETVFDKLGAWDEEKPKRILQHVSLENVGISSVLGHREVNEDRFKVLEIEPGLLYCGVFDGHGGTFAANFVSETLHIQVRKFLRIESQVEKALVRAFEECNDTLANTLNLEMEREESNEQFFTEFLQYSGTTGTIALVKDSSKLYTASVGDSRAILSRHGESVSLTSDHIPTRSDEKQRIKEHGGWVDWESCHVPMVNGRLAMTRSFGDLDLKSYGVISTPETSSRKIDHSKDGFLILTTDGVSFALSDQEVVDMANACSDAQDAANMITCFAMQSGSEDNATALVVPFGSWRVGSENNSRQIISKHSLLRNIRIKYM